MTEVITPLADCPSWARTRTLLIQSQGGSDRLDDNWPRNTSQPPPKRGRSHRDSSRGFSRLWRPQGATNSLSRIDGYARYSHLRRRGDYCPDHNAVSKLEHLRRFAANPSAGAVNSSGNLSHAVSDCVLTPGGAE